MTVTTELYEQDFYHWTQDQAAQLRAKAWHALDIEHLAEEIESLGRSERFAIESHLINLLTPLLKYRYDPATAPRRLWRLSIRHARREIAKRAQGSLQQYPAQYLPIAYLQARKDAADETDLPLTTFPETCPWTAERILEEDFYPER